MSIARSVVQKAGVFIRQKMNRGKKQQQKMVGRHSRCRAGGACNVARPARWRLWQGIQVLPVAGGENRETRRGCLLKAQHACAQKGVVDVTKPCVPKAFIQRQVPSHRQQAFQTTAEKHAGAYVQTRSRVVQRRKLSLARSGKASETRHAGNSIACGSTTVA